MDLSFVDFVMSNGKLATEHREELKVKRGFSDDVIDKLKFISSGDYFYKVKGLDLFPEDKRQWLVQSKEKSRIIIPFIDPAGKAYYLRPHKMGFSKEGSELYVPFPLFTDTSFTTLVVAESEFKAVASTIMGINSVGIPGISTFSGKNFQKLISFISAHQSIERIVICFDNEIKDTPGLGKYIADYKVRYETIYWAYAMARLLQESYPDKQCLVATIPKKYMIDGKIDIDGMLAMGEKKAYLDCIDSAVKPEKFRESWVLPEVHRSYLSRRIDRAFYKGPVVEMGNKVFIRDFKKSDNEEDAPKLKPVTNFRIEIVHTMKDGVNTQRLIRFISDYGNSQPVLIESDAMTSKMSFCKFCYKNGDYRYTGNDTDLQYIWDYLFMHQDGRQVNRLQFYGYHDEMNTWFFENSAYTKDGNTHPVDENSIVWIGEEGYRLFDNNDMDSSRVSNGQSETFERSPKLSESKPYFTLKDIYNNLSIVKGEMVANLMLAWTLGHFFLPEIYANYNVYPFMFFHGKQNQGKSTTASWISYFFGFEIKGFPLKGSSVAGIVRVCSQFSMLPVWFEEYRNDPDIDGKNSFFRSVYDHSTIVKGQVKSNEIMTIKARSTLLLSGQEYPNDSALNSRCIHIPFAGTNTTEEGKRAFYWLEENKPQFRHFGHEILTKKEELWPKIKAKIDENMKMFTDHDIKNPRAVKHSSILGGIANVLFGSSVEFSDYLLDMTKQSIETRHDEQELNVFFDDIRSTYQGKGWGFEFFDIAELPLRNDPLNKVTVMMFFFNSIYTEWHKQIGRMRKDIPTSKSTLQGHLESEPYFIGKMPVSPRGNSRGRSRHAWVLNMSVDTVPQTLFDLLDDYHKQSAKRHSNNEALNGVKLHDLDLSTIST